MGGVNLANNSILNLVVDPGYVMKTACWLPHIPTKQRDTCWSRYVCPH